MWSASSKMSGKLQLMQRDKDSVLPTQSNLAKNAFGLAQRDLGVHSAGEKGSAYCRVWKRVIDVVVSSLGLIVLSPFLVLIAVLIKCSSRGPVLYWQDRVGKGGKFFRIVKFRSMVADADKSGSDITSSGDPRVTRVGEILRKLKVDELPQLWNVLIGEMSLVGPRPELPRYVADYNHEQLRVLSVRPGITDLASIRYRHEEEILAGSENPLEFYRTVVLNDKLVLNLLYIDKMSFSFDAKLIFQTLKSLFV